MLQKKKVLLITRNFPPLTGGMEKLLSHVYHGLKNNYQMALVTPGNSTTIIRPEDLIFPIHHSPTARFLINCHLQAIRAALSFKPDIIISGSGLTAPAAIIAGKISNAPVITLVHGLDVIVDNFIYHKIFIPAIRACNLIIANSHNTEKLAKNAGVNPDKIRIIYPGVSIPSENENLSKKNTLQGINFSSRPVMLSLGRLTARKGLIEFIENSLPLIIKNIPDVLLIIIGEDANNAIGKKTNIKSQITALVNTKKLENHVLLTGYQDDASIVRIYAESNVFIFPIIEMKNDIEGFGMVALEAASYGLPTVCFSCGGVPDAVKQGHSGYLVEPGDYQEFSQKTIKILLNKSTNFSNKTCTTFAKQFAWTNYYTKLNSIVKTLV